MNNTKGISIKEIQKIKETVKRCRALRQELKNTNINKMKGRKLWILIKK
jgi:hypothetical protein